MTVSRGIRLKHGHAPRKGITDEYRAWLAMRARCAANKGRDYLAYKARGIEVCERWDDFEKFLLDMGRKPSPAHSLGRKNNDLGYSPENCRWETPKEQLTNRRTSVTWHIRGAKFETCRDAGKAFDVDSKTICYWVKTRKVDCYVVPKY